jgi:hypothetical protein
MLAGWLAGSGPLLVLVALHAILTSGRVEVASARKRRVPLPSRVEIGYRFEGGDAVERTEADVEERRRRQRGMGIR